MPRTFQTVDGVIVESTSEERKKAISDSHKKKSWRGKASSKPALKKEGVSGLRMPRRVRLVDDVIFEDKAGSLHTSVSDSALPKLSLPRSLHSSGDVAELASPSADERVSETNSILEGLDLDEMSSSGRLTPLSPHSLSKMIIDEEERTRLKTGIRPHLGSGFEYASSSSIVPLKNKPYVATKTSVIFEAERTPDLLVKYQVDCFDIDTEGIHPLLKDYWFLRRLGEKKLTPRAYFLSAPASMPIRETFKTTFLMTPRERYSCAKAGGRVRYMLSEKVGKDIHSLMANYAGGKVPVEKVFRLGVKMMDLIRKLHDEGGVVHGDIHTGNICFKSEHNHEELRLIDFGRANLVVSAADGVEPIVMEAFGWNDPLLSPWNMEGFREARRDDVFKVLIAIAFLMNGHEYAATLRLQTMEEAYEYKTRGDIFTIPGRDPVVNSPRVALILAEILQIVRMTQLDQRPDYEAVISRLTEAVAA